MVGSQPFNFRTLREGPLWNECLARLKTNAKRLDGQILGITWQISHDAESQYHIRESLYIAKTDPWPGAPSLRIFFTIDDADVCTLHWVELAD